MPTKNILNYKKNGFIYLPTLGFNRELRKIRQILKKNFSKKKRIL